MKPGRQRSPAECGKQQKVFKSLRTVIGFSVLREHLATVLDWDEVAERGGSGRRVEAILPNTANHQQLVRG